MYLRPEKKLPTGDSEVQWTGTGHWYCRHCRSPVLPNRARGHLSKDDRGRIGRVAQLHSNDGWGDEFRHAAVIACRLPNRNAFDTPPTAG